MSRDTTINTTKEVVVLTVEASSTHALNATEEVSIDHVGERGFCGTNLTDPGQDFAFGMTLPIIIPKEVAIKRDWCGTKSGMPTFSNIGLPSSNIVLSLPHNADLNMLMSTGKGAAIPGEVVLNIIEKTIDLEPTSVLILSLVSKGFKILIDTFEKSIVRALILNDDGKLRFTNSDQSQIIGITNISAHSILDDRHTYKWYSEMRSRAVVVERLAHNQIMHMDLAPGNNWPTLDIDKKELYDREIILKKNGLLLLFKLADSIVGLVDTDEIRNKQSQFLDSLSEAELAILIASVELLGVGFRESESFRLKKSKEAIDHHTLTELGCVFADKVQRFGPYFASAYLYGELNEARRPDIWAWEEIEQGLEDLRSFELGYTMAYASLQSVGWKLFIQKMGCIPANRWFEAKKLIEVEMAGYKL